MGTDIISILYASVAGVSLVAYIPQIIRIMHRKTACHDIAVTTWMIWNYTAFVTVLYAYFITQDMVFSFVSAVNLAGINIVILMTAYKRWKYKDAPIHNTQ